MIELVKSQSMRVPSKGRHALWLVVALAFAFAALVFAAGAQAQETNAPDAVTEAAIGEAATESGAPPEGAPPTTEQTSPTTEQTPPATETAPPVAEQAPPAAEEPTPIAEQAPPVAAEAAPPTTEITPPPTEQAPPTAETKPPTVEPVPPVAEIAPPAEKKTVEQTDGGEAAGAGSEGLVTQRTGGSSQASAAASGPTHNEVADEVAPGDSIVATASTFPGVPAEVSTVEDQPSLASSSRTTSPRRAGQASCERVAIGAPIATDEADGWLNLAATTSVSTTDFAAVDTTPTAITAGATGGSQDGGSAVENHPSAPTPGPGPGGVGGGSAAGGGSGSTSSASFTLVGAFLQTAPRAMRRFRLAQPSWRTSFFVLIPERPD
jgi:hypothetical protein